MSGSVYAAGAANPFASFLQSMLPSANPSGYQTGAPLSPLALALMGPVAGAGSPTSMGNIYGLQAADPGGAMSTVSPLIWNMSDPSNSAYGQMQQQQQMSQPQQAMAQNIGVGY